MARIRTIKPEYWTDEKIVELSFPARLLFIGLWNFADDEGRLVYSPKRLKMQIFPADDLDVSELFGEIRGRLLAVVYEVDNVEYLQVVGFSKHQKIDRRSPSKLPPPPSPADSPRVVPTEGIKEGKGGDQGKREGALTQTVVVAKSADPTPDLPPIPESLRRARGSRLLLDSLPDDWRRFCKAEREDLDPERIWAIFQDHWRGKAGQSGVKLDWLATWRNWVRREGKGNGINRQAGGEGRDANKDERAKAAIAKGLAVEIPEPSQ